MTAVGPAIAVRAGRQNLSVLLPMVPAPPPLLVIREAAADPQRPGRTKIWEFNTNLHCSIIGTCLSAGELRQILRKLGLAPPDSTDHQLHGTAVTLAGRHDRAARLLNKALDARHKLAISRFAKVDTEARVGELWREAAGRGDIPGAYWATLTHPATTPALVRAAFGDVHMLSHLVGSANRADIQRLCRLEADKAELEARLARQQHALHEAVVTRDARIEELRQALMRASAAEDAAGAAAETSALRQLVCELERRLESEASRRAAVDGRMAAAQSAVTQERTARLAAEHEAAALRSEIEAVEGVLAPPSGESAADPEAALRLDGITLLYVGGRPNQVPHLRAVSERLGAVFLHHDGGVEHQLNLLTGLARRADLVLFPVDCISHEAARAVKLLCRQTGRRFVPLRSAAVSSWLAALRRIELAAPAPLAG